MAQDQEGIAIASASGETGFVPLPVGTGMIMLKSASTFTGAIVLVAKSRGSSTEYVIDTIDQTAMSVNTNEGGTGYSFGERIKVFINAQVALKANSSFVGSVTASIISDEFPI